MLARSRPLFVWDDGRTKWQIDGWPGLERLVARFNKANSATWSVQYCPNCPPGYPGYGRGGQYGGTYGGQYGGIGGGRNPLNPWSVVPPPPGGAGSSQGLLDRLQKLEDAGRKALRDHEDTLRKLRNDHDDALRSLKRKYEDEVDGLRRGDVRAAPSLLGGRAGDTLATAIDQYRSRSKAVKEQEASLKAAATDIDRVTAEPNGNGMNEYLLPGALIITGLAGAGAYARKKPGAVPAAGKDG